jgi:N-methylhydantoinase B
MHDEPTVGGWGGSSRGDGQDCLVNASNGDFKNFPVEIFEEQFPLIVKRYEIRPDSEGPGKFRGGMGAVREYETLADETYFYSWFERSKMPAWGVLGGKAAESPEIVVVGSDGEIKLEKLKVNGFLMNKGWKVTLCTGGGGGYGNPFEREPEKVLIDYICGYISRERALNEYGVVITEVGELDLEATMKVRDNV